MLLFKGGKFFADNMFSTMCHPCEKNNLYITLLLPKLNLLSRHIALCDHLFKSDIHLNNVFISNCLVRVVSLRWSQESSHSAQKEMPSIKDGF